MMVDTIFCGDALEEMRKLPAESVDCCITSPPYFGLRDYGVPGQIGLEASPEAYVARLVEVFREVRRVLKDEGTLWLNLGDSYAGSWGNYHPNSPPGARWVESA
jgi:DNA modification methylase